MDKPINLNNLYSYETCRKNVTLQTEHGFKSVLCAEHLNPGRIFTVFSRYVNSLVLCEVKLYTGN